MTQPPQRIIDTKLPLTWLLSTAGALILALGMFALTLRSDGEKTQAKLDILIINIAKLEKRVDDRDTRTDAIKELQYAMQRIVDTHALRIESLERRQK